MRGRPPLADRNSRLLARWIAGVPTHEIAAEFGVSPGRVKALAKQHRVSRAVRPTTQRATPIPAARIWDHIDKSAGPNGCWEWIGHRNRDGYGQGLAHRRAWKSVNGPIPEGMMVLHRCDNRPCCNPRHLYLGTAQDNIFDAMARGRWQRPYLEGVVRAAHRG